MLSLGAKVPLALQVFDGREDLTVKVRVFDALSVMVFEGVLAHVFGGLYESTEFLMPDSPFVVATYAIFDGKTISGDYGRASETFYLCPPAVEIEPVVRGLLEEFTPKHDDFFTGKVEFEGQSDDFFEARLSGTN